MSLSLPLMMEKIYQIKHLIMLSLYLILLEPNYLFFVYYTTLKNMEIFP